MNPEKHAFGWYLYNLLNSDCCALLLEVVDQFAPWLEGETIKPDRPRIKSKAGRRLLRAQMAAGEEDVASRDELLESLSDYANKPDPELGIAETNTKHAAAALGLDTLEQDILALVIRGNSKRQPMRDFINHAWERVEELPRFVAALLGVDPYEVELRLDRSAKLMSCGLITVDPAPFGDFTSAAKPLPRVARLMRKSYATAEAWAQELLGEQVTTPLNWSDFAHVHDPAEMAARLLRRAARDAEAGVHVLLVGLSGTGKTELAKALAARARLNLFAAGESGEASNDDDTDDEPSRSERFGALRLACSLLARVRKAAVLLDEAEDVLESPRSFGNRRDAYSKVFLHRTLETLPVPVIWTCNDLTLMDPATLRRMTMVIDVPVPDLTARTRIWQRVVNRERLRLPSDAAERLARRWDVSAGVAAGAARAARLTDGNEAALERALRGVNAAMGQREHPPQPEVSFDLDLVRCAQDLRALCDQLAKPGISRAWSLCISGPPGTGKSAFARHMARCLDLPVLQKRASDLLSMFVGGSEKAIARAFREARDLGAVLLIDEAEALLFDRTAAVRSWEISQVSEMLTWMENHPLPFVCTTNLLERVDHAVPRRFTLKLRFEPLDASQLVLAFRRLFNAEPPGLLPDGLTPGDFAVVQRKAALFAERDPDLLLAWLQEEADTKADKRKTIGFRMDRPAPPLSEVLSPRFPRAA
jgi:SpoVK/Ycf46/Vps4 family AAA+-type ATPase